MAKNLSSTGRSFPAKLEELALEFGSALSSSKVQRLSIHDATGKPKWNSDGRLSPSESAFVLDALDSFALESSLSSYERETDKGQGLVAFAARDPRGALHGTLLVEATLHTLGGRKGDRTATPVFSRLLHRLALRLAGDAQHSDAPLQASPPSVEHSGLRVTLYVQQLLKLRSTGRTRRYEVLLRADAPEMAQEAPRDLIARAEDPSTGGKLDRTVLAELCNWLAKNRKHLDVDPASFTVNVSTGALLSDTFTEFCAQMLKEAHVNPRLIGFEIREAQCREHPAAALRFIQRCEKMGCQIVIDDFTFHSDVLQLLRQRAVRMLKMDQRQSGAGAGGCD
jgi:EAL domain-containing protein (putative c-di-GMP-specific phosphodiesterase class I)